MSKGQKRQRALCALAAACLAAGAGPAKAALMLDLQAVLVYGSGTLVDAHHVTGVVNGDVISYEVHALITSPTSDPTTSGFQDGFGVIATSGPGTIQANLTHAVAPDFHNTGSSDGTPTNLGGDTDTDIGPSLTASNGQTGDIFYRTININTQGYTPGLDLILGTGTATISDDSLAPATLRYILPATTTLLRLPSWVEDGVFKNRNTGKASADPGITITGVPEPASLALLSLGGLSLLRRPQQKTRRI